MHSKQSKPLKLVTTPEIKEPKLKPKDLKLAFTDVKPVAELELVNTLHIDNGLN